MTKSHTAKLRTRIFEGVRKDVVFVKIKMIKKFKPEARMELMTLITIMDTMKFLKWTSIVLIPSVVELFILTYQGCYDFKGRWRFLPIWQSNLIDNEPMNNCCQNGIRLSAKSGRFQYLQILQFKVKVFEICFLSSVNQKNQLHIGPLIDNLGVLLSIAKWLISTLEVQRITYRQSN